MKKEKDRSKWGPLEFAREALQPIWEECHRLGFKGRCNGQYGNGARSKFPGSNIILCDGATLVIIHSENGDRYGPLCIKAYMLCSSQENELYDRVDTLLKQHSLR